jgi:hypothetical protein
MNILIQKQSCYKELLRELSPLVGFVEPVYYTLNATSNVACVVFLASKRSRPFFGVVRVCVDLLEIEESSANNCLRILVTIICLCVGRPAEAKCEQYSKLDINMTLSLANSHVVGRGVLRMTWKFVCMRMEANAQYQLSCISAYLFFYASSSKKK